MRARSGFTLLGGLLCLAVACAPDEELSLDCDDLLPAEQAGFVAVRALVVDPGPKSCSRCHNTISPVAGLNFEGPGVAWDALSTKSDRVYAQVASGRMPDEGERWSEDDLRLFRSWVCHGALYDEAAEY